MMAVAVLGLLVCAVTALVSALEAHARVEQLRRDLAIRDRLRGRRW